MAHAPANPVGTPAIGQTPPWWTEADDAELAALMWELVDAIFTHKERCERCLAYAGLEPGSLPCPNVVNAVAVVCDWHHGRELQSRALWLRRQRELLEYERDVLQFKASA